jgi:hypothetical protein
MGWSSAIKWVGGKSVGFLSNFRVSLLSIVFVIILIQSVIISVEQKSIEPAIEELGNRFILVTETIDELSLEIIENKGSFDKEDGVFKSFLNFFKSIWVLLESLVIMYFWISILAKVSLKGILQDDSKTAASYTLGTIAFFVFQIIAIQAYTDKSMMAPFLAFRNLALALPYIFKPIADMAQKIS